jgi:hypothetical protein
MRISDELRSQMLGYQKNEITEYHIYMRLAKIINGDDNKIVDVSVAKEALFKRRFLEMSGLSLGVAAVSFVVGYILRSSLGVDV